MTTVSIRIPGPRAISGHDVRGHVSSALQTLTSWLRSTWCVLNGGHYKVLHTEPDRMALRCVACGHRSPGWEVGSPRLARARAAQGSPQQQRRPAA